MKCLFLVTIIALALSCNDATFTPPAVDALAYNTVQTTQDMDFWIRYLLALRIAQFNNYNNYYRPQVPAKPVNQNCKAVGQSCTYHEECCSFACIGYLKKCVSG